MEIKDSNAFITPTGDVHASPDTGHHFGTIDEEGLAVIKDWGEPEPISEAMKGWPVRTGWDDEAAHTVWKKAGLQLEKRGNDWYVVLKNKVYRVKTFLWDVTEASSEKLDEEISEWLDVMHKADYVLHTITDAFRAEYHPIQISPQAVNLSETVHLHG